MRNLFARWFGRDDARLGDLAGGDWAPIPASAVAEPADRLGWLSDAPPPPLRQVVMAPAPSFTQGELAIIEEQRRAMQPLPRPVPPPAEAAPPEPPAARPSWVEVLKAYAEHLTDAELSILRQQYEH